MKIVIDVPEEEYTKAKCKGLIKSYKVVDAFRDATPLEKVLGEIKAEIENDWQLKEMPSAKEIESILAKVGYDKKEFYALYGEEKIKQAINYAKDLKDRYSVLWLNYDLNGDN